ncbi:TauD/TfdA dioxygenase family protein [Pseudomaricurvus sp.]|uniref:TauD/TfdA dioxygenase family protein n=1 Tax=Pseudomaricurvus sp. TaxID=2004510 RepID=UPI003F6A7994
MNSKVIEGLPYEDIKPEIGARILCSKEEGLSGVYAEGLRELLEYRGVLVFPEVHFNDEEQIAFTNTLGKFAAERSSEGGVYKVTLDKNQTASADYLKAAFYWHFDGYVNDVPIRASLLSCKVTAPTGGNTEFANTYAAYEALPEERKAEIADLKAVHSLAASQLYVEPQPTMEQFETWMKVGRSTLPLVWTHQSGRKSLAVGCSIANVVDMDPMDGLELTHGLRDWATQERFVYSHEWKVGDAVMWDNTGTLHRAMPYSLDSGRMMHRTKLEGEEPIG